MQKKTTQSNSSKKGAIKPSESGKGRPKGLAKTGGRQKGTPNKMTSSLRKRLEAKIQPFIDDLDNQLARILDPKDRIDAITKILPYIAPKLQSIDMKSEEERSVTVEQYLVSLDEKYSEKKAELQAKKVKLVSFD